MHQTHCSFCGNRKRPLKFHNFWNQFQCYPCIERRITLATELLVSVEIPRFLEKA